MLGLRRLENRTDADALILVFRGFVLCFVMSIQRNHDPEIIVFPVGTTAGIPETEQQRWQRWPTMSAVKQGRFYRISSVLLDRPGPRIVEGLEALARSIHPEAFESRRSQ